MDDIGLWAKDNNNIASTTMEALFIFTYFNLEKYMKH